MEIRFLVHRMCDMEVHDTQEPSTGRASRTSASIDPPKAVAAALVTARRRADR
jgi:hypothetical protein